jgi:hypothetical protein
MSYDSNQPNKPSTMKLTPTPLTNSREIMASQLVPGQRFMLYIGSKRIQTMLNKQGNGAIVALSEKSKSYLLGSHIYVYVEQS